MSGQYSRNTYGLLDELLYLMKIIDHYQLVSLFLGIKK